jgi:tetratricopeptide (TPR) repeat protein/DNA-binding CsgD family transcriptional regulator
VTTQKRPHNKRKRLARYTLLFGLWVISFGYQPTVYAALPIATINRNSIFEHLKQVSQPHRLDTAYILYRLNFRRAPLAVAMANLDTLSAIATQLGDLSLQCAVFDMHADYYSVNTGFNKTSTSYYQKAIDFAIQNDLPLQTGIAFNNKAVYYFIYKKYADACHCFLQSDDKFREIGYANVPKIHLYLLHAVNFYYALGDYDNARVILKDALEYVGDDKSFTRDKINIVNTLALIYRNYKQYPNALYYFKNALNIAVAAKDTVWIGIVKGNIGSVYFLQGDYSKALPYINADYNTSIKHGEPVNGAMALSRLIKINIDSKRLQLASKQLDTIQMLIKGSREDVLGVMVDYYDLKSQLFQQLNRPAIALSSLKMYELQKDSLMKRNNIAAVERIRLRYETDKHAAQLSRIKSDQRVLSIKIYAVIAVSLLLMVISILLYNRQRLKDKRDKELLMAEKRVVDEQLKSADVALHGFTENIRQKNLLIEKFKNEIENLNKQSQGNVHAGNLEKMLQAHIMTDENWNDFKKLFSKVHPGFFVNLSKSYPRLSAADTRLLALVKLGLNNAEMANMLGITVEGIKKAKQRLRKKINTEDAGSIINLSEI